MYMIYMNIFQDHNLQHACIFREKYAGASAKFRLTLVRCIWIRDFLYILFTLPVSNYFEQNWKKFLDDCFIFLRLSLLKPNKLLDVLNNINPVTQFTMETSDTQLPFLDVMINKEGKRSLWTFIQNQRTQKDMSPSNQTTPSTA